MLSDPDRNRHQDSGLRRSRIPQINRRRCESAHTFSEMGKLFVACSPPPWAAYVAKEAAMLRTSFCNRSLSRIEIDQRSREARFRLEQIERLLIPYAAVRQSRFRHLLSLSRSRRPQKSRRPMNNRRPPRMPTILVVRRLRDLFWPLIARQGLNNQTTDPSKRMIMIRLAPIGLSSIDRHQCKGKIIFCR